MKHSLSEQQEIVIQNHKKLSSITSEKFKNEIKDLVKEGVAESRVKNIYFYEVNPQQLINHPRPIFYFFLFLLPQH